MNGIIGGIAFIVLGLVSIYPFIKNMFQTIDSIDWVVTDGEIIESGLVTSVDRYISDSYSSFDFVKYSHSIRYKYSYNGESFIGSNISFIENIPVFSASIIKKKIKKYQENRIMKIYVSPSNPKQSVIERGIKIETIFGLLFGIVILFLGVATINNV